MQGTVTITDRAGVKVHTYTAPEQGLVVNTHLIELPTQLVAVDAQYGLPYAREVVDYAQGLGKPIARLYVTHEHPDHYFGASVFGAPIYALAEVKRAIEDQGDALAAQDHAQCGDFVPAQATKPGHVVKPGEQIVDGVRLDFRKIEGIEAAAVLTIALPDHGVVITQDLVYNKVHLFAAARRFDTWAAAIERYKQLPYDTVLPGHGAPGGRDLYDQVLDYLAAAKLAVEQATTGGQLKTTLTQRFRDYRGTFLLDIQNMILFPPEGKGFRASGSVRLASARGRWVLAVAVLGEVMTLLEATVVNVSLPAIGRDLGADVAGLQWTLNGYVLTLAALILLGGSLGDIYGRRRVFNLGVVVFLVASALCAAAPSIELLIVARFLQGIGGALLTPASLAIIAAVFHPDDRARAIGLWAGLGAIAGAIGPLLGGYLTDAVSWRAVFLVNFPLGIFVVVAANLHVPETRDSTLIGGLDLRGAALATLGIGGVCFALIQVSEGLTGAVIAALAVGLIASAAFIRAERRSEHPMLPLEMFRSRQFASANLLALLTYVALGGVGFLFVAFLQATLGYTALEAGAATLPITFLLLLLSAPSGALAQRVGPRIPLTIGALLTSAGMLLMSRIEAGDEYFPVVMLSLVVFGVGLAAVIAPIIATALATVDSRQSGIASAVNNAASRLGQLVAVASLPLAAGLSGADFQDPAKMADGFPVAMTVAAGASFAAAVLAWTTISDDVLSRPAAGAEPVTKELPPSVERHRYCPVAGTPLRPPPIRQPVRRAPPMTREL
ncbi:MAG: DHA2 family efflux MFS transporter permease subunit [Pseudonocardiaceae bacterium]